MTTIPATGLNKLILEKTGLNIEEARYADHYLTKECERINQVKDPEQHADKLCYFEYLLSQLQKIKEHNQKDFNDYLNNKLAKDSPNLSAPKFELLTYTRLLDHSIPFAKAAQKPGFEFTINTSNLYIECATRQTDFKGYFVESVKQAITTKHEAGLKQNHSNQNTALHLEISRTIYNTSAEADFSGTAPLEYILEKTLPTVNFGAVVLINSYFTRNDGVIHVHPIIRYNDNCNPDLKELHGKLFKL